MTSIPSANCRHRPSATSSRCGPSTAAGSTASTGCARHRQRRGRAPAAGERRPGPMPVMISRCGRLPRRHHAPLARLGLETGMFCEKLSISASTAWVSSARAPLPRTSVRKSVKAAGWPSLMTLLSEMAYHCLFGEMEALNTTTIRRLIRSGRHQPSDISSNTEKVVSYLRRVD
jgi:hypothetical protein